MVFEQPEASDLTVSFWSVLVPTVAALGLFSGVVVLMVGRSLRLGQQSGVDEMIGSFGNATTSLYPSRAGKVFIRGEYWNAMTDEPIHEGDSVEVVAVEGLRLRVKKKPDAG